MSQPRFPLWWAAALTGSLGVAHLLVETSPEALAALVVLAAFGLVVVLMRGRRPVFKSSLKLSPRMIPIAVLLIASPFVGPLLVFRGSAFAPPPDPWAAAYALWFTALAMAFAFAWGDKTLAWILSTALLLAPLLWTGILPERHAEWVTALTLCALFALTGLARRTGRPTLQEAVENPEQTASP